jgi:predicted RNase H-like nuclease (RuvC/YqgF family)
MAITQRSLTALITQLEAEFYSYSEDLEQKIKELEAKVNEIEEENLSLTNEISELKNQS